MSALVLSAFGSGTVAKTHGPLPLRHNSPNTQKKKKIQNVKNDSFLNEETSCQISIEWLMLTTQEGQ